MKAEQMTKEINLYRSANGGRLYVGSYPTGSRYMICVGQLGRSVNYDGSAAVVFTPSPHVSESFLPTGRELRDLGA